MANTKINILLPLCFPYINNSILSGKAKINNKKNMGQTQHIKYPFS